MDRTPSRPNHPSALRRAVARLSILPRGAVDALDKLGWSAIKVANALRFERFWQEKVAGNRDVIVVPSFTKAKSKHAIWDIAIDRIKPLGAGNVLEFGTNNGGWMRYFLDRLPDKYTLHGFDSFEGLPEEWDGLPAGSIRGYGLPLELWGKDEKLRAWVFEEYKKTGEIPAPPQKNVVIHVGLFMNTLPEYYRIAPDLSQVRLIHFDADIYISTRPVLDQLCGAMSHEYYILFDELYSVNHEFRAWQEFIKLYGIDDWEVVAISEDGVQNLVRVAPRPVPPIARARTVQPGKKKK